MICVYIPSAHTISALRQPTTSLAPLGPLITTFGRAKFCLALVYDASSGVVSLLSTMENILILIFCVGILLLHTISTLRPPKLTVSRILLASLPLPRPRALLCSRHQLTLQGGYPVYPPLKSVLFLFCYTRGLFDCGRARHPMMPASQTLPASLLLLSPLVWLIRAFYVVFIFFFRWRNRTSAWSAMFSLQLDLLSRLGTSPVLGYPFARYANFCPNFGRAYMGIIRRPFCSRPASFHLPL